MARRNRNKKSASGPAHAPTAISESGDFPSDFDAVEAGHRLLDLAAQLVEPSSSTGGEPEPETESQSQPAETHFTEKESDHVVLQRQLDEEKEKVRQAMVEVEDLKTNLANSEPDRIILQDELEKEKEKAGKATMQTEKAQIDLAISESDREVLQRGLNEEKENVRKAVIQAGEAKTELNKTKGELDRCEKELETEKEAKSSVQTQLDNAKAREKELRHDLRELQKRLDEAETTSENLLAQNNSLQKGMERKATSLQSENRRLQDKIEHLESIVNDNEERAERLRQENSEMFDELEHIKDDLASYKAAYEVAKDSAAEETFGDINGETMPEFEEEGGEGEYGEEEVGEGEAVSDIPPLETTTTPTNLSFLGEMVDAETQTEPDIRTPPATTTTPPGRTQYRVRVVVRLNSSGLSSSETIPSRPSTSRPRSSGISSWQMLLVRVFLRILVVSGWCLFGFVWAGRTDRDDWIAANKQSRKPW